MQERLFEVEDYTLAERLRSEKLITDYPLLSILGITVDQFDDVPSLLLEVTPKPDTQTYIVGGEFISEFVDEYAGTPLIYRPSGNYKSRFTDKYADEEDNSIRWDKTTDTKPFMGFLQAASSLDDSDRTVILHLASWVTDLESSIAVRLDDIAEISKYPKNAADVLAAYQNAFEDGTTYFYQQVVGLPTDVWLSEDELAPLVHSYWWPMPKLIYSADKPVS